VLTPLRVTLAVAAGIAVLIGAPQAPRAQGRVETPRITPPQEQFGHDIGADYQLVNYTQYVAYLQQLDRESDRMTVVDIGPTAEGRREYTAIVTSPANHRRLAEFKSINRRLALAEGLTDDAARRLAADGRVVIWIDGGLHANEVLGAQQLIETMYQLVSRTDDETRRILDETIVLLTNVNPDGMELVSDWYMREADPARRSTNGVPRLYQKYIGHDNNRDFYMMNQPETENANRMMYREWFPAVMYNHHQTGPQGTVLFAPPFRDPFNYHFDPLIPLGINLVGAAIHTRLAVENKPGAVSGSAASYSTWWNGGLRTMAYFHNQIGILTEMIGNPTPVQVPFVPDMQLRRNDVPNPVAPQPWPFRRSVDYSVSINYAILELAASRKDDFLFNMYAMGRNSIARGSQDHWTVYPKRIEAVQAELARQRAASGRGTASAALFEKMLRDPRHRDPRAFVLRADQPDFLTATKFVNILIKGGVTVHRATDAFSIGNAKYPAGSFVVKTAQAFRPHVMDMFEPQDHPNDIQYPGGPPRPPYDVTGYNLSYSMGVQFDRILEGVDGPLEALDDVVPVPAGRVSEAPSGGGWLLSRQVNDAFVAVNRLLAAGDEVRAANAPFTVGGVSYPAGTFFITPRPTTLALLQTVAKEKGVSFESAAAAPNVAMTMVRSARIGLWDMYGGSMPSGWTRWLLEQFEFPFEVVYPQALDAGRLANRFDVLLFVTGGIPAREPNLGGQPSAESVPAEYRERLGTVSVSTTVPQLKTFAESGGTLVAIGSSTSIGQHLGLPIRSALTEFASDGTERALPPERFYIPGSLLETRIDNTHPLAYGMGTRADVFFDDSPAFRLLPEAQLEGVRPVAWFDSATPLRSGWAWGQERLQQAVAILDAPVGEGRVVLFGPEVAWRAQPHGTFKMLFNALLQGRGD